VEELELHAVGIHEVEDRAGAVGVADLGSLDPVAVEPRRPGLELFPAGDAEREVRAGSNRSPSPSS